jgi:hypothetical protein
MKMRSAMPSWFDFDYVHASKKRRSRYMLSIGKLYNNNWAIRSSGPTLCGALY